MKLFRKMRAHSIEQGNGADYWKYALGEIVFVVVGILLAFQIDTWSERRNAQAHTQYLFGQVQEELVLNIENCTYQIASYRFTDTLVKNILTARWTVRIIEIIRPSRHHVAESSSGRGGGRCVFEFGQQRRCPDTGAKGHFDGFEGALRADQTKS